MTLIKSDKQFEHQFEGLNCMDSMTLAMKLGVRSEHHARNCQKCRDDATKYYHCSWCGETYFSYHQLWDHLNRVRE